MELDAIAMERFNTYLNTDPPPSEVFENKHAGNTKYLPISFLEMELDQVFFGVWETKDFKTTVIGNELAGSVTLRVYHPIANVWIERVGAAGTMIRTVKDMPVTVENKIKNAIEMDYPHLLADCFRNACKHLGKRFGRDLNRKYVDHYRALMHESEAKRQKAIPEHLRDVAKQIADTQNANELSELHGELHRDGRMDADVEKLFSERKKQFHAKRTA